MGVAVQKREGVFDGGWNVLRHIVAECVPIVGRNSIDFCELLIGLFKKSVHVFWQARADAVVSTSARFGGVKRRREHGSVARRKIEAVGCLALRLFEL